MTLPSNRTHKSTFRLTPKRRVWYQRLTPAAWLLAVVGGILVLVTILGLFRTLFGERDVPFVLPATHTPEITPSLTPRATPAPTATPEAWVWWADQMMCDDQAYCIPPEEVIDAIIAAYWAWKEAIPFYYYELDMTPQQLAQHYTGEILALQLAFVSSVQETGSMQDGEKFITEYEYETRVPHVANCTPDGLTCQLGETLQGDFALFKYSLATRQIVETVPNPKDRQYEGVNIWQCKYDLEDSKWKVEKYIRWVPAP